MSNKKTKFNRFLKCNKFAFAYLFLSNTLFSQDSTNVTNLKEIVISASKTEQNPTDVGRSITIIDKETIDKSNCTNISELLSKQEGIFIVGSGQTPGSLQNIYLRGANSGHTFFSIDGMRISDPSSVDNSINLAEISLANIERIEIVRGSHSTLFGSSAIGGVINIITKNGAEHGFKGSIESGIGTFGNSTNELIENCHLSYKTKYGIYCSGDFFYTQVNGLDATIDTVTSQNIFNNRDRDNFNKMDGFGKIGYKNKKWDLFFSMKSIGQKTAIDDGAYRDDDNYTIDFKRKINFYQITFEPNPKLKLKFAGSYSTMSQLTIDDSSIIDYDGNFDHSYYTGLYSGNTSNNEMQLDYKSPNYLFVTGISNYREGMSSQSIYCNSEWSLLQQSNLDSLNINAQINSCFAHFEINGKTFSKKMAAINLALGIRYNHHNSYGNYLTYEINPSYKVSNNCIFYSNFSSGFNSPALYKMYAPDINAISKVTRGNSLLTPESSFSSEFGLKHQIDNGTLFTVAIFKTKINNYIEYVYLWDNAIGIDTLGNNWMRDDFRGDTYINIGQQCNYGFECSISSKINQKLTLIGNLSIISGKTIYQPEQSTFSNSYHIQIFATGDFVTKEIQNLGLIRRSNTANLTLHYQLHPRIEFSPNISYTGSRSDIFYDPNLGPYGALNQKAVADYSLVNFSLKIKILKSLNALFSITNAFNTRYQEIYGYSTKGRGFYLKVKYSI